MTYIVIGCYGRQQLNDVIRLRASFPLELFSQLDDFRYSMLTHLTLIYSQFWWGGQKRRCSETSSKHRLDTDHQPNDLK
jgi:hypothetical protein